MEENGQLHFSDDPIIPGLNEACSLIETGQLESALLILDGLLNKAPDAPGIEAGYRIARFWLNRAENINDIPDGKDTADFLLEEWQIFLDYARSNNLLNTHPFHAIEKYIHYTAGENYKLAFKNADNPTNNIDAILKLAICFMKLGDYNLTIDTLEYARSSSTANPELLALLGESYYHRRDIPKALLLFREAFFIDPTKIDLNILTAEPIIRLKEIAAEEKTGWGDVKEWIPVFGHLTDIFYVKRHLTMQAVDLITKDIYTLEKTYQTMSADRVRGTNTAPRLINKYLWLFDFYKEQNYNFENLSDIRSRLIEIDKKLFDPYFKNIKL